MYERQSATNWGRHTGGSAQKIISKTFIVVSVLRAGGHSVSKTALLLFIVHDARDSST